MSILIWFILIAAFMFFMHRSRSYGSMGGCGSAHTHGAQDRTSPGWQHQKQNSRFYFADIQEAEYIEIKEE